MARASLPMYDLPELRAATDAWWAGLAQAMGRAGLSEVPQALTRGLGLEELWRDPRLLLSQTCGYPLIHAMKRVLRVVATPVYDAPGCEGADYRSLILVRADDPARSLADLRGRRGAVNGPASHSGYNALRSVVAAIAGGAAFFSTVIETGGHLASAEAMAEGRADVAAIDCVTYALVARHRPAAVAGLRVLGRSEKAPGLPYVTRAGADGETLARLRDALAEAFADPSLAGAREALLLKGHEVLPPDAYERIDEMEAAAVARGYPRVA